MKIYGGDVTRVIPVSTASLNQKAARPLRGGLRTEKLENLGIRPTGLQESLEKLKSLWQADPF